MNITKRYGFVEFNGGYSKATVYINNSPKEYHVSFCDNYQHVQLLINNVVLIVFTDTVDSVYDLSTFTRKLKKPKLYFCEWRINC